MPKADRNTIIREGKTIEDAIERALKYFGITQEQAEIEVLSEGKKGFFGIGRKPARVKVVIKEEVAAERELSQLLDDLNLNMGQNFEGHMALDEIDEIEFEKLLEQGAPEQEEKETREPKEPKEPFSESKKETPEAIKPRIGLAEVKDGRVIVHNPTENNKYAVIAPGEGVTLFINEQRVETDSFVSATDDIRVELKYDEPESYFDLKVSRDKVEAYIRYINRSGAKYRLKDESPKSKLILTVEVEDIIEAPHRSLDELKEFLQRKKIVRGIIEENLVAVLENPNSRDAYLVARGELPVDGKDAYVRYLFEEKQASLAEAGLFEHGRLVSVIPGEVIAVKVHKEEGQDGWDIYGEKIPHKGALDCEIKVKRGCEIVKGGEEAVSLISGRPFLENMGQSAILSVEPIYVVQEVSPTTGNIKFAGDVEVKGDVRDGCCIEADGNVEVYGNVSRATVKAGSSVIVHKMVLGSMVIAGGRSALYSSILPMLEGLVENLGLLYSMVKEQRESHPTLTPDEIDGPLIQFYMDHRLPDITKTVLELFGKILNSGQNPSEVVLKIINELYNNFCGMGPLRIISYSKILEIQNDLEDTIDYIKDSLKKASYIKARYVQNSNLICSGNVIIDGQGCYTSSITAGGAVDICGNPGYARGVRIDAGNDVTLKDVGSDFDTQTLVKTAEDSKIIADTVNANVLLQIGKEKLRIMEPARNFIGYLNEEGLMAVSQEK